MGRRRGVGSRGSARRPVVRPTLVWVLTAAVLSWTLTHLVYLVFDLDFGSGVGAEVADWAPLILPLLIAPITTLPGILLQNRLAEANERLAEEVTRRIEAQAELERLSRTDPLTGVANRRGFFEDVARVPEGAGILVVVDLDGFKAVNDGHGHAAGDAVLRAVADVLRDAARPSEGFVARIGGDEFVALLPARAQPVVGELTRRLAAVGVHLDDGTRLITSASVGHAAWSAGQDVDTALAAADAGMYADKRSRRPTDGVR
ncbi:GGDEF domain-containing protein [Kineococcus gynurae]|uniref:GGDEF domain-containing protein n=1 Tax=Kineococcus gynurae TaxID=452979 RepID=A0ABV5LPI6_9ACTN